MATNNTIKLAEDVLSAVKRFKGELTAEGCRQALGKSYFFHGGLEMGDFQCSPRGVKLIPKGEDFMDLTWSKFIKFCRENGLMEEATTLCNPKPAPSTDVAATAADPAAASPAATSTTWESAADAAASTLKPSSPDVQTPLSAPASPADAGVATQNLSAAAPASSAVQPSASSAFDYAGLDLPTVDTLHLAERMIADARRDYVAKLAQAVYIAHDALCGGVVQNLDNSKHGHRGDDAFVSWCASVGMKRSTAYNLLQVAGLLNGATHEEQAVLEAASYERKKSARSFAGPYMTNSRPADVAARASSRAQRSDEQLRLLSNVADWAGITYGKLMLKSQAERESLILEYKAANGGTTHE